MSGEVEVRNPETGIHPKAHVDSTVTLGDGTNVWQFASITRGAVLGRNCSVSPFVMLDGSNYGDRCIFSAGFAAGAGFLVGNDVFFGPSSLLVNDLYPLADKDGYDDAALRSGLKHAIIIGDGAVIGGHAVVLPGVRIGKGAIVAAGAVIDRNLPDGMTWTRSGYINPNPPDLKERRMRWAT